MFQDNRIAQTSRHRHALCGLMYNGSIYSDNWAPDNFDFFCPTARPLPLRRVILGEVVHQAVAARKGPEGAEVARPDLTAAGLSASVSVWIVHLRTTGWFSHS